MSMQADYRAESFVPLLTSFDQSKSYDILAILKIIFLPHMLETSRRGKTSISYMAGSHNRGYVSTPRARCPSTTVEICGLVFMYLTSCGSLKCTRLFHAGVVMGLC